MSNIDRARMIPTTQVKVGDYIVGWSRIVASIRYTPKTVFFTFTDGETYKQAKGTRIVTIVC